VVRHNSLPLHPSLRSGGARRQATQRAQKRMSKSMRRNSVSKPGFSFHRNPNTEELQLVTTQSEVMRGSFPRSRCIVPGCMTPARILRVWGIHGRYCETHRRRWRVHGAPTQASIWKHDLQPLIKLARRTVERDKSGKIESSLCELHAILHDYATEVAVDLERGVAVPKWTARGAREVLRVTNEASAVESACVVASVFLLRDRNPYMFVSQRGFEFELVRAYHKQVVTAWGRYWSEKGAISKTVYHELPPRCVDAIAVLLIAPTRSGPVTSFVSTDKSDSVSWSQN